MQLDFQVRLNSQEHFQNSLTARPPNILQTKHPNRVNIHIFSILQQNSKRLTQIR